LSAARARTKAVDHIEPAFDLAEREHEALEQALRDASGGPIEEPDAERRL
jgi:hypothetical protein